MGEYARIVGIGKVDRELWQTFTLAIMAGVQIGLGGAFMLVVKADALSPAISAILSGICFSVGLLMVMATGTELFTGDMLVAVGWRRGFYNVASFLRLLAVVYAGNLLGSLLLGVLLMAASFGDSETMAAIAQAKCALSPTAAFARGILCNVLVCLAVSMGIAASTETDKLAAALLPVACFVACGFEHSVADMLLLPLGMAVGAVGLWESLATLLWVTAGNVVGGLFVALIWHWGTE